MATKPLPAQDALHQLLSYDAETGELRWRRQADETFATSRAAGIWNARFADKVAFDGICPTTGYRRARIKGVRHRAHRIIWKMVHGVDPLLIDHINRNRTDNRLCNLRSVGYYENRMNSSQNIHQAPSVDNPDRTAPA